MFAGTRDAAKEALRAIEAYKGIVRAINESVDASMVAVRSAEEALNLVSLCAIYYSCVFTRSYKGFFLTAYATGKCPALDFYIFQTFGLNERARQARENSIALLNRADATKARVNDGKRNM